MKKAILILAITVMAACCLIAYDATRDTVIEQRTVEFEKEPEQELEKGLKNEESDVTPVFVKEVETETEIENDESVSQEEKDKVLSSQEGFYAFPYLSDEEKEAYAEILTILKNYDTQAKLTTKSPDVMDKAFQCVMMDHPEIFYVNGYNYTKYTLAGNIKKITFSGTYTYDKEQIKQLTQQVESSAEAILQGIDRNASDYEKVKYIYETLVNTTEYDLNSPDNQNILSVLLNHRSVCQGYAKTMQFLLNRLNVMTTLVTGTVQSGTEGHAWNLVLVDNAYYYVDSTWGDAYYLLSTQDDMTRESKTPAINYDYLCVTTKQIEETHQINSVVPMPDCVLMDANYYVRQGAYFTVYDEEKIEGLFHKAIQNGEESVTLKCDSNEVYQTIITELIDNQKVFHYMDGIQGSIAYTKCEEQRSISFWL